MQLPYSCLKAARGANLPGSDGNHDAAATSPLLQAPAPRGVRCASFALPSFLKVFVLTYESTFQKLFLRLPFNEEQK